MTGFNLFM